MTPITFAFDTGEPFAGFTDGSHWNGFNNVWVTPDVRDQIVATFRLTGWWEPGDEHDMLAIPVIDGLVSLANGYATVEVEDDTPDPRKCQHRDDGRGCCIDCGAFLDTWEG